MLAFLLHCLLRSGDLRSRRPDARVRPRGGLRLALFLCDSAHSGQADGWCIPPATLTGLCHSGGFCRPFLIACGAHRTAELDRMADDRLPQSTGSRSCSGGLPTCGHERGSGSVICLWSRHTEIEPASEIVVDIVRWAADSTFAGEVGLLWLWSVALWADLIGLVPGARPDARLLPVGNCPQPARPARHRRSRSTRPRLTSAVKAATAGLKSPSPAAATGHDPRGDTAYHGRAAVARLS